MKIIAHLGNHCNFASTICRKDFQFKRIFLRPSAIGCRLILMISHSIPTLASEKEYCQQETSDTIYQYSFHHRTIVFVAAED